MKVITYSPNQEQAFEIIKNERSHLSIQATAGSGKTTTILGALRYVPQNKKTVFLSFANAIVDELKESVPAHVRASTLHSLGNGILRSVYKRFKIEKDKYFKLALDSIPKPQRTKNTFKDCANIQNICNFARMTLTPFKINKLEELCDHFGLEYDAKLISKSIALLKEYTKKNSLTVVDFSDMIYFPAIYPEFITDKYDFIFLDEAQDINKAQFAFIEGLLKEKTGRIISVGDERQSIYGFSGSDIFSFDRIRKRINTKCIPLTVSYRCPKTVVDLARTVYPDDIQAAPEAEEGIVRRGNLDEVLPGNMVICRNTQPLIYAFFDLIDKDIKSYIVGKDLEKGLIDLAEELISKSHDKDSLFESMIDKLEKIYNELVAKEIENPTLHPKYINILEKCDMIKIIFNKVKSISDLISKIKEIFHEDKQAVKLLTAHRAKGLENDRVFFIEHFNDIKLLPSKWATQEWEKIQEKNLLFVVYTRSKNEFIFVDYYKES